MEKRIGIIGIGSMGKMLLKGFINKTKIDEDKIFISTKSDDKKEKLKCEYSNINVCDNNSDVARNSDLLFICVKPMEMATVLNEIKSHVSRDTHLVSIAACVTLNNIEDIISGKITKIIPSLTSEVFEGITLSSHNNNVSDKDIKYLNNILGKISTVKTISENDFEIGADLTSCAPGLIAAMFNEYVNAALPFGSLTKEEATDMVVKTLYGTAKLIKDNEMSFSETLDRVATKGGITQEGAKVLQNRLPGVFKEVFEKTLEKHETIKSNIIS